MITPDTSMPGHANPESIAERHGRWIVFGSLSSVVVVVVLSMAVLGQIGQPWLVRILGAILAMIVVGRMAPQVLGRLLAGRFVDALTSARLTWEPTSPTGRSVECSEFFLTAGFVDHGSWMVVDADSAEVLGGVGSRFFYHPQHHVSCYVDDTQVEFRSQLSDGRFLVTTSVGAVPHTSQIIQGIKQGEFGALLQAHFDGLTVLGRSGLTAVEPTGGPLGARRSGDQLDQEFLGSIDRRSAVRLMHELLDQDLSLLATGSAESRSLQS